jgi:hypothetical protein
MYLVLNPLLVHIVLDIPMHERVPAKLGLPSNFKSLFLCDLNNAIQMVFADCNVNVLCGCWIAKVNCPQSTDDRNRNAVFFSKPLRGYPIQWKKKVAMWVGNLGALRLSLRPEVHAVTR